MASYNQGGITTRAGRQPALPTRNQSGLPAQMGAPSGYDFAGLTGGSPEDLWGGVGFGGEVRQNPGIPLIRNRMLPGLAYGAMQDIGLSNELQPAKRQSILALLQNLSPGNRQAMLDQYRRQMQSQKGEANRQALTSMGEQGYGGGMAQGMALDAANYGADAAGTFGAYLNSPEGQTDSLSAALAAIGMAQPNLSNWNSQFGNLQGWTQQQSQESQNGGILNGLAGLAGSYVGGGGKFK